MVEITELILRLAKENLRWGYTRIRGALSNLGHTVSRSTIANILREHGIEPAPEGGERTSWRTFLTAHWRCCTARSKSLTSLCRLQSHPAQYVSGIPSAAILLSISHPIRCSTRCLANVRARISGPMIAL